MRCKTINNINIYYYDSQDITIEMLKRGQLYAKSNFDLLSKFILEQETT